MSAMLDNPQKIPLKGELYVWFLQMTKSDDRENKNPQAKISWRQGDWQNPGLQITKKLEAPTWMELIVKVEDVLNGGPEDE